MALSSAPLFLATMPVGMLSGYLLEVRNSDIYLKFEYKAEGWTYSCREGLMCSCHKSWTLLFVAWTYNISPTLPVFLHCLLSAALFAPSFFSHRLFSCSFIFAACTPKISPSYLHSWTDSSILHYLLLPSCPLACLRFIPSWLV